MAMTIYKLGVGKDTSLWCPSPVLLPERIGTYI